MKEFIRKCPWQQGERGMQRRRWDEVKELLMRRGLSEMEIMVLVRGGRWCMDRSRTELEKPFF